MPCDFNHTLIPRFGSVIRPEEMRRKPKRRKPKQRKPKRRKTKHDFQHICIDFHLIDSETHNFSCENRFLNKKSSIFLSFYCKNITIHWSNAKKTTKILIIKNIKNEATSSVIHHQTIFTFKIVDEKYFYAVLNKIRSHRNFKKTQLRICTRLIREIPFFCFSFIQTFSY